MEQENVTNRPRRESAVDIVIGFIKGSLLKKDLRPGDRIPNEFELSNRLSVSRGSVREAMKILSALGVVRIARGDGTYVSESFIQSLFDPVLLNLFIKTEDKEALLELREMFEIWILRLLIKKDDARLVENAEQVHRDIAAQVRDGENDPAVTAKYDVDFHLALAEATGNIFISEIYGAMMNYFYPMIEKNHQLEGPMEGFLEHHSRMLQVIRNRDESAAESVVDDSVRWWLRHHE